MNVTVQLGPRGHYASVTVEAGDRLALVDPLWRRVSDVVTVTDPAGPWTLTAHSAGQLTWAILDEDGRPPLFVAEDRRMGIGAYHEMVLTP